jgi:hypothetical protein
MARSKNQEQDRYKIAYLKIDLGVGTEHVESCDANASCDVEPVKIARWPSLH